MEKYRENSSQLYTRTVLKGRLKRNEVKGNKGKVHEKI